MKKRVSLRRLRSKTQVKHQVRACRQLGLMPLHDLSDCSPTCRLGLCLVD